MQSRMERLFYRASIQGYSMAKQVCHVFLTWLSDKLLLLLPLLLLKLFNFVVSLDRNYERRVIVMVGIGICIGVVVAVGIRIGISTDII
jgi:predicted MFS family arabinose efflux permease